MRNKIILALIGLCFTSCTMRTSSLPYSPVIAFQKKNYIPLHLEVFEDYRKDCQKIGVMRNLFGMPIVRVYTQDSISYWVKNALTIELKNSGYSIIDNNLEDIYVIDGIIKDLYFNTYACCFGRITIEMIVKKNENIIFQKLYKTAEWTGFFSGEETLMFNLQKMCNQFISDLNGILLNK